MFEVTDLPREDETEAERPTVTIREAFLPVARARADCGHGRCAQGHRQAIVRYFVFVN
jgi:hypothetical protein